MGTTGQKKRYVSFLRLVAVNIESNTHYFSFYEADSFFHIKQYIFSNDSRFKKILYLLKRKVIIF